VVDLQKIDLFFEGTTFKKQSRRRTEDFRSRVVRFMKLIMPLIAIFLTILILILPSLKKNNLMAEYSANLPKKDEVGKLHAEDATFSITEKDGKISTIEADSMDETQAGSKVIKIINPKGKIPVNTKEVFIDISAKIGFFNQKENIINLEQNVKAVYDNETTVETEVAEYNFAKAYGKGDAPVYAYGSWGKLWSKGFSYDKNKDILFLEKNTKIVHEDSVLTSERQVRYYKDLNKIEAEGNVVLQRPDSTLYAQKVILFLQNTQNMEIKKIEAFKNVKIETQETTAFGDYGIYLPSENQVELQGNVEIQKDGSSIYGDKVVSNLETMISKMVPSSDKKRVSGVISGSSIKRKKQ